MRLPLIQAVVLLASSTPALAGGQTKFTLTSIPASSTGITDPKLVNNHNAIAGEGTSYRARCWSESAGVMQLHPAGNYAGSWIEDMNDAGQVLSTACITPPGGTGTCGSLLTLFTPAIGLEILDYGPVSGFNPARAVISSAELAADGTIAIQVRSLDPNPVLSKVLVRTPAGQWIDLTPLAAEPSMTYAELVDVSDDGRVLFTGPSEWVVHTWSLQEGHIPQFSCAPTIPASISTGGAFTGHFNFGSGTPPMPIRFTTTGGWELLDPESAFPRAIPKFMNAAGDILGTWQGGWFMWSPGSGMSALDLPLSARIVGFNDRGDITAHLLNSQTYQNIPTLKMRGQPARSLQTLLDPTGTRVNLRSVSSINNSGAFAVVGTAPGSFSTLLSFLVTQDRCLADFDASGSATTADMFAFLNAWFASSPAADADRSGQVTPQDIFEFMNAWFVGC